MLLILRYGKWSSISMYRSNKQPLLVGRSLKQQRREKSSWGMMVCVCNDEDIQLRDRQYIPPMYGIVLFSFYPSLFEKGWNEWCKSR